MVVYLRTELDEHLILQGGYNKKACFMAAGSSDHYECEKSQSIWQDTKQSHGRFDVRRLVYVPGVYS